MSVDSMVRAPEAVTDDLRRWSRSVPAFAIAVGTAVMARFVSAAA